MIRRTKSWLDGRFGSWRGLVRLVIANLLWRLGPYRKYGRIDAGRVRRVVFVCQGNICRSPFAQFAAAATIANIPVTSVGLGASEGERAFETALAAGKAFSIDMSAHRAVAARGFAFCDGDLCLVMEDRHIPLLLQHLRGKDVQVGLLGLWCRPRFALLYDPHRLGEAYFLTCFDRIRRSVEGLAEELRSARPAGQGRASELPGPDDGAAFVRERRDQTLAGTAARSARNGIGSET